MLDILRRGVKSRIVQVMLGLLVASFAVWGVPHVSTGFSTRVATIGEQTIDANLYANALQRAQQRYGLDPSAIASSGLDRFVLGQMVREAAFDDAVRRLGVSAPDWAVAEQVRANPAFQSGGAFDATQYAESVRRSFASVPAFESTVRRSIAAAQLQQAVQSGARAPEGIAQRIAAYREERRSFDAFTLTAQRNAVEPAEPTDAQLAAYLNENEAAFAEPERRDVTYLDIGIDALAAKANVDDAQVRELYESRRAQYVTEPTRTLSQIIYPTLQEAQDARARVEAGATDFAGLLAERNLTAADADLGVVRPGDIRDARKGVAFARETPGLAGPAQTATGFALLDVRAASPGDTTPLDAVRDDLRRELGASIARPEADHLSERVADAHAGGATLEEVAREMGLALGHGAGLARDGTLAGGAAAQGLAATQAFRDEAFAASQGAERDLVRTDDGGYFTLRVDAVTPPSNPGLEDIRDKVAAAWRADARRKALIAEAEAALARIEGGAPVSDVAAGYDAQVTRIGPIRRADPAPGLDADAVAKLFDGKPGDAVVSAGDAAVTVAVLREVGAPEALAPAISGMTDALNASVAQDQLEYLGRALEARAGVSVNPQALDAVLSQLGAGMAGN